MATPKSKMKLALLLVVSICLTTVESVASDLPWDALPKVGHAKLKFGFWDIYRADLLGESDSIKARADFALKVTYLRSFNQKQLIKETQKQLERLGEVDDVRLAHWMQKLSASWPDINKGDELMLYVDTQRHSYFYLNNQFLNKITDLDFAKAFSDIWLSEKTSRPKIRLALLGDTKNGE